MLFKQGMRESARVCVAPGNRVPLFYTSSQEEDRKKETSYVIMMGDLARELQSLLKTSRYQIKKRRDEITRADVGVRNLLPRRRKLLHGTSTLRRLGKDARSI